MTRSVRYIMGVDGGGTSCRLRLCAPDGSVLAESRSGSANIYQNTDLAWKNIEGAAIQALQAANLTPSALAETLLVAGLAGAESSEACVRFKHLSSVMAQVELLSDAQTACIGAHKGRDGSILIVGTGIIGIGIKNNEWHRVSGWGFPLDDIGSGAWLGQQALQKALSQYDRLIEADELTTRVWQKFENKPDNLLNWSQSASSGDYGQFAPLVLESVECKAPSALEIEESHRKVISRLITHLSTLGQPIALMGGLSEWTHSRLSDEHKLLTVTADGSALDGAIELAMTRLNNES